MGTNAGQFCTHDDMNTHNWYSPLPGMGILSVSGKDAAKLLQGQTTCDILGLPPGQTTLGALCSPKGKAIALFRVLRAEDRLYLLLPDDLLEIVQRRLRHYVLRDDVKIANVSGEWAVFGLYGEKSPDVLQKLGLPLLTGENEAGGQSGFYTRFYAVRIPGTSTWRFLVLVDAAKQASMLRFVEGQGLQLRDSSHWQLEDIRAGIPSLSAATTEEFVPQMLNLDLLGGISFNKGCYTGQEIIARTHYLGSLKRRMVRLLGEGVVLPEAGEGLTATEDDGTGKVLSAAPDGLGGFEILAVVKTASAKNPNASFTTLRGIGLSQGKLPYPIPIDFAEESPPVE